MSIERCINCDKPTGCSGAGRTAFSSHGMQAPPPSDNAIETEFYAPVSSDSLASRIHIGRAVQFPRMIGEIKEGERIGHFKIKEIRHDSA